MEPDLIANIKEIIFFGSLPGAAGGVVFFLYALQNDHYQNDKHAAKFLIEISGAILTASFLSTIIDSNAYRVVLAFSIGSAWSKIIQMIRVKITKIVEAALGEKIEVDK